MALTPQKKYKLGDLEVKEYILPNRPKRKLATSDNKPQYITIHNTDKIKVSGTTMAEQYTRATLNGNMGDVFVHYYLDEKDCWHNLPNNEAGQHAADGINGTGNSKTLAIEIIMDGTGSASSKQAEDRGAYLAAYLLNEYKLPIERLKTHKDWYPKKTCPIYILPHWNNFKARVQYYLNQLQEMYRIRKNWYNPNSQIGAFTDLALAKKMCDENPGYKVFNSKGVQVYSSKPLGDIDQDGKVTSADARLALRHSVGLEKLNDKQIKYGDVDGDGKITSADAREISRISVGLKKDEE